MRIAICDDCREDALLLAQFLISHQVYMFESPEKILENIKVNGNSYDILLLDIYMESTINGVELAKEIRNIDEDAQICFISSSADFYREAYDIQDINYLLKPVTKETFEKLIERVERRKKSNRVKRFHYKWNGHPETVSYNNILYISSSGHNADIVCKDGTTRPLVAKLNDIEDLLDKEIFMRCHQSFLVNIYQVDSMNGNDLLVAGHIVPISRKYYSGLKRRYQEILFEEVN